MEKKVINRKYFIGWKIFMYVAFLVVYSNCFYFVRQYTLLNNEVSSLKKEVNAFNQVINSIENEQEKLHIYGVLKKISSDNIEYDYVNYFVGLEALHVAQDNGACENVELKNCDFPISGPIIKNDSEKVNKMLITDTTKYWIKTDQFSNRSTTKDEFSNYYSDLLQEGKLEVKINYESDVNSKQNVATAIMVAY